MAVTAIDIGTGASNLDSSTAQHDGYTYLDYNNAANATGRLSKFEVYADAATMYNVRFGTFSYSSGTTFTPRAWTDDLGDAPSGQKTTFTPSGFGLEVSSGDYLAIYWETSGALSFNATGGSGLYRFVGRPTSAESFTLVGAAYKGAISASGITPPANATSFSATGYTDKITLNWTKSADVTAYVYTIDAGDAVLLGDVNTLDDTTHGVCSFDINAAISATDGTYTDKVALSTSFVEVSGSEVAYQLMSVAGSDNTLVFPTSGWLEDTAFRAIGDIYYQFKRDDGAGYTNIGSKTTTSTYDDTGAPAPVITPGTASASDGTYNDYVVLGLSGHSIANGATATYKCTCSCTSVSSRDTSTDTGYRGKGTLSYQWQRSAGDSDASYSDISGGTTIPYNDTEAPSDGSGRYFKCKLDAANSVQQVSTANRGFRFVIYTKNLADSVSLSEARIIAYGKKLSDSIGLSDLFGRVVAFIRSISDSVGLSDSFSRVVAFIKGFSDTTTLSESVTKATAKIISDITTLSDTLRKLFSTIRSDSISLSDSYNRVVSFVRSMSDSISLSESIGKVYQMFLNSIMSLSDSARKTFNLLFTDVTNLSDSRSSFTVFIRSFSDNISVSESFTKVVSFFRSFSDTLNLAENAYVLYIKHPIYQFLSSRWRDRFRTKGVSQGELIE